jgi:rod shape-determining protein MreD
MLNNQISINITRFILLVLVQVWIFNNLNLLGYINPMVYVLFLYWYPLRQNRSVFLVVSFALGFVIDIFSDTMAIHAISAMTMAYIRPLLLRFCYGNNYEFQGFSYTNTTRLQRITFMILLIVIHHLIFFSLEILSFYHFVLILKKVLFTSGISLLLCLLFSSLFAKPT